MIHLNNRKLVALISLCLIPMMGLAVSEPSTDAPTRLHLSADQVIINYKARRSQYIGHVHVITNNSTMDGDKLLTYRNARNKIKLLIDYGNLAHYTQKQNGDNPPLTAQANIIKYYPIKHLAILIGNAYVVQGSNTIRGPLIEYDTQNRILKSTASKLGQTFIMYNDVKSPS